MQAWDTRLGKGGSILSRWLSVAASEPEGVIDRSVLSDTGGPTASDTSADFQSILTSAADCRLDNSDMILTDTSSMRFDIGCLSSFPMSACPSLAVLLFSIRG